MSLPISVIIPTYRRPELTAQALVSIYRQTELPSEVTIVNDGGECANLQRLCKQVAQRFAGVPLLLRLQNLPRHLGMPGAVRNIGMRLSSQPWLAFLDSDDVWLPQKLQQQWQCSRQSQAKIIYCKELWLRFQNAKQKLSQTLHAVAPKLSSPENLELLLAPGAKMAQIVSQKKQRHRREGSPQQLWPEALKKCILGPSTVLLHRSVCDEVGYFAPKLQIAEDYEYFLRVLARFSVAYCPQYLVAKRDSIVAIDSGLVPQLSHKQPWIEPFRSAALEKLLLSPHSKRLLSAEQQSSATAELRRKLTICLGGARKRLNIADQLPEAKREKIEIQTKIKAEIQVLTAKLAYWKFNSEN